MLELDFLPLMQKKKNLLAFSGGIDSSALYFLLQDFGVAFDIALVDYGIRKQSKLEANYAKTLCFRDKRQCFIKEVSLNFSNFQNNARAVRYGFFEELIRQYGYENLLLAHQFDDKLEWFLMQFCKGTSLELMALPPKSPRIIQTPKKTQSYQILRPMHKIKREEILDFLHNKGIFYFEDFSNQNFKYTRNLFRNSLNKIWLKQYYQGIAFSLQLLEERVIEVQDYGGFYVFSQENALLKIDKACKKLGLILSKKQKLECQKYLLKPKFSIVFGGRVAVEKQEDLLYVAPFIKKILSKKAKEFYRQAKIPPKIRCFLEDRGITCFSFFNSV